jgi:uncharacterized protein (TIRG00374 family)
LVIGLLIAGGALYYTLSGVSMGELMESFKSVHYIYLLPSIVLMVLSYVFRAYRWRILLQPVKQVEASSLYSPLMVGFMGNILPARAGEVVRAYLLSKKHEISFAGAVASIIVERLFDIFMLLLLFSWVFIGHAEIISPDLQIKGVSVQGLASKFGMISATLLVLLIVFIYLLLSHKEKMLKLIHFCTRPLPEKWKGKVEYLVEEFILGFQVAKDMSALMKITGYSLLVWGAITLSYYPMYWAYDLQVKSMQSVVLVTVLVAVLITVLPTPAFLGSFNAAVLIALHDIMNESEIAAVSFGMVTWALSFGVIFVGGRYFILHDHLSVKKLVEVEETDIEDLK